MTFVGHDARILAQTGLAFLITSHIPNFQHFHPTMASRLSPAEKRANTVRLNLRHQDMVRSKIRALTIVRYLQAFFLGEEILVRDGDGTKKIKVDLTDAQLRAANMLLDRCLPSLKQIELKGGEDFGRKAAELSAVTTAAVLRNAMSPTDAALEYERLMLEEEDDSVVATQPLTLPAPENSQ